MPQEEKRQSERETTRDRASGRIGQALGWGTVTAGVIGLAVSLAFAALPQRGTGSEHNGADRALDRVAADEAADSPATSSVDKSSGSTSDTGSADAAKSNPDDTSTTADVDLMRGAQSDAATARLSPVAFGPPERVRSVAENAIRDMMADSTSDADLAAIKSALVDVRARRIDVALDKAARMPSPAARALVRWYAFRFFGGRGSSRDIMGFLEDNPNWPERALLVKRAEQTLFLRDASPSEVRTFFKDRAPTSASGAAALAVAEQVDNKTDVARKLISDAWREGDFGATVEAHMLKRLKPLLTEADYKWRMDRFLLNDSRYGRKERLAVIKRMRRLLGPVEKEKATARELIWRSYYRRGRSTRLKAATKILANIAKRKAAEKVALPSRKPEQTTPTTDETKKVDSGSSAGETTEIATAAAVPTSAVQVPTARPETKVEAETEDWPFAFQRIQMLRRQGRNGEAWRRLLQAPTAKDLVVNPDGWWVERRTNAYDALYKKSYRTAYRLVANPGPLSVNEQNEASFMAGWLALRYLSDPEAARRHFEAFTTTADGPRSRAQSHFWLARTFETLGEAENAKRHDTLAAREFQTFYGQLARQKLDPSLRILDIPQPPELTKEKIADFRSRTVIEALRLAHRAGHRDAVRRLLRALRKTKQDPHVMHLLAEFAKTIGDTQMSVRIGKSALFHKANLTRYAYPTHAFPMFKPLTTPPEPAMLYGLARQESEFNTLITSIAGARGVLQVMQITARDVCRIYRLKCGSRNTLKRRLSADPSYNATLASAYISDRQTEFGGSYILTMAGYNAGPGRARYWIRKNGDPRDPKIDPLDWIESIHLKETRNYVKKVMANMQIYRALLDKPDGALQITTDINRGAY